MDSIRAAACWNWVALRVGRSSERIEAFLTDEQPLERAHKWDRYRRGQMCPKDDGSDSCTVGVTDRKLPGFRSFFHHPVWTAIRSKKLVERQLAGHIRTCLHALGEYDGLEALSDQSLVRGIRRYEHNLAFALLPDRVGGGSLDSLAIALLMLHDPVVTASAQSTGESLMSYHCHVPMLRVLPEFFGLANRLTDLIDQRYEEAFASHDGVDSEPLETSGKMNEQLQFLQ